MKTTDIAIIGGGIVGLATAYHLTRALPDSTVSILEKEPGIALHQTGHNSGVLHSGIYYKPGSLKAITCRKGKAAMEAFCEENGIAYDLCGKVIVAVEERELPMLDRIYERGQANGVACSLIDADRLKELEPHAAGLRAIHVPEAGIVDYKAVARALAHAIASRGAPIFTGFEVQSVARHGDRFVIASPAGEVEARYVVNCAGLYTDRIARLSGLDPDVQIVPFRGEYYTLKEEAQLLCRSLIYPVPDPDFPFLGVHFTRMIHGGVECGPNAVLAFAREGYTKAHIDVRELAETLGYRGFRRLAATHLKQGTHELWRSFSKRAFVKSLRKLIPAIEGRHLDEAPAGVRAQAIRPDGSMVDDFLILESDHMVHVCNAPSPAATASLQIGEHVAQKLLHHVLS